LPVAVRVVDSQGRPVEGAPVRLMHAGDNGWSVAHNTDQGGLARFHAPRNSAGRFWLSDLAGPREAQSAANLYATFNVGDEAPAEHVTIRITQEQAELLGPGQAP
jgi:hypothetical protein